MTGVLRSFFFSVRECPPGPAGRRECIIHIAESVIICRIIADHWQTRHTGPSPLGDLSGTYQACSRVPRVYRRCNVISLMRRNAILTVRQFFYGTERLPPGT